MSKFHVSKKKKEKRRKSALKIIYMYPCMIVCKKKKVFHFKSTFHNHKLDACHIFISFIRELYTTTRVKAGKMSLKK